MSNFEMMWLVHLSLSQMSKITEKNHILEVLDCLSTLNRVQMIKCNKVFHSGWLKLAEIYFMQITYKLLLPTSLTRSSLDCVYLSENNEWKLFWLHYFILMQQNTVRVRLCKHMVLLHNLYNDDDYGTGSIWEKESNWQRVGRSTSK